MQQQQQPSSGSGAEGLDATLHNLRQQQQQLLQLGVYKQLHRPETDGAAVKAAWLQQQQESLPGLPYTPPGTRTMAGPNLAPAMPTPGTPAQPRSSLIAMQQDQSVLMAHGPSSRPPQAAGAGSASTGLAGGSVATLAPAGTRQVQQERLVAFESTLAAIGGMISGIYKLCRTVSSRPTAKAAETCRFMMQQVELLQQQQQWLTEQMEEEACLEGRLLPTSSSIPKARSACLWVTVRQPLLQVLQRFQGSQWGCRCSSNRLSSSGSSSSNNQVCGSPGRLLACMQGSEVVGRVSGCNWTNAWLRRCNRGGRLCEHSAACRLVE